MDANGDTAVIPDQFTVSTDADEQTIQTGLVVIGSDGSEFVWVPTTQTDFTVRDFGSYMGASGLSGFRDETELETYQEMVQSVEQYGGFYMGRFEASFGSGDSIENYVPASKRVTDAEPGRIWIQFSPQDTTIFCQNLYAENETVQGFFPWGTIMTLPCTGSSTLAAKPKMRCPSTAAPGAITVMTPFQRMPRDSSPASGKKPRQTTFTIWRETTGSGPRSVTVPAAMSCAAAGTT